MALTLRQKYEKEFEYWGLSSTSHGIPRIFKSKNKYMRSMWFIVFVSSFCYCTFSIIKSTVEYLKYKTTISIQNIQEIPQTFPAVTICNLNAFNEEYALSYLWLFNNAILNSTCFDVFKTYESCLINYNEDLRCGNETSPLLECMRPEGFDVDQVKSFIANHVHDKVFRKQLGFLWTELVFVCTFNRDACGEDDFASFWNYQYGNCYTFNHGTEFLRDSMRKGINSGLQLEISIKSTVEDIIDFSSKRGLYVVVHNQSSLPFTLNNGIFLSPGFAHVIRVNRVLRHKLDYPHSNCITSVDHLGRLYNETLFALFKDLNISYYEQDICFSLCQQVMLIERCGCSDVITPAIYNASYCMNDSEVYGCMNDFYANRLNANFKVCEESCPQNCKSVEYEVNINSGYYATLSVMRYLTYAYPSFSHLPDDDEILLDFGQQAVMSIDINFENSYYTLIEEYPTSTYEKFLSTIGGQLGLFIGISFLSFIEVFELIFQLIYLYFEHRKTMKKTFVATQKTNVPNE